MSDLLKVSVSPNTDLAAWDAVTVTQFELKYKHLYEVLTRNLDGVFTEYHNVEGHQVSVPMVGSFTLADRGKFSSKVVDKEIKVGNTQVTLQAKASNIPIDIILAKEIKANILTAVAAQVAGAVKRCEDQFVIEALKAAYTRYTTAMTAAGADEGKKTAAKEANIKLIDVAEDKKEPFTINHLVEAKVTMDSMGIPSAERHFVAPASLQKNLLLTTKITSTDYAAVKALVFGEIHHFLGFTFHWIPNMPEGGMPENIAYAFHKSDGVQAWGLNSFVKIYYENSITSNVAQAVLHGAAKVLVLISM